MESSGEFKQQNIQDGGHEEEIENAGESAGNRQTSKSRKPSFRRPNRDYSKHNTWTYEMNKDLYKISQIMRVIKKKLIRETGFDEAVQPKEQNRRSNRRKANSKNEDGGNHN